MRLGRSKNSILTNLQPFEFTVHQSPVVPSTLHEHATQHKPGQPQSSTTQVSDEQNMPGSHTHNPEPKSGCSTAPSRMPHASPPEMTGSPISKLPSELKSSKHLERDSHKEL